MFGIQMGSEFECSVFNPPQCTQPGTYRLLFALNLQSSFWPVSNPNLNGFRLAPKDCYYPLNYIISHLHFQGSNTNWISCSPSWQSDAPSSPDTSRTGHWENSKCCRVSGEDSAGLHLHQLLSIEHVPLLQVRHLIESAPLQQTAGKVGSPLRDIAHDSNVCLRKKCQMKRETKLVRYRFYFE